MTIDLTKIDRPFGELDDATQGALETPPKAKPLVWEDGKQSAVAHSMGYTYYIAHDFDGWRWFRVKGNELDDVAKTPVPNLEAAKATAEADYQAQWLAMWEGSK